MPQVSDNFGPIYESVVLDGSGAGAVSFQATGSNIRLTNIFFNVNSRSNQAVCTIYKGQIAIGNIVYNSNSGSTGGNAQGNVDLFDGETCYVVWTGGDAGATATATFSGGKIPLGEVKPSSLTGEAVIAAGDGSLVYPALKSPNYVAGVSGWKLDRLGDAEVNSATVRGSLIANGTGGTYIEIEGAFPVTGEPAISLYPGTAVDEPAYIYAADNLSGFTQLALVAPADTGFPRASIEIYGATTLQPTDKRVAIAADSTTFSGAIDVTGEIRYESAYATFSGSIANNTVTSVTPSSMLANNHGIWVSGSTFTIPTTGTYEVGAMYRYATNAVGQRQSRIEKNGADLVYAIFDASTAGIAGTNSTVSCITHENFTAGDTVTFRTFQNSGGALSVNFGRMWVKREQV